MSLEPLVSMITPCYNGEHFVSRFFESVLNQTYPNIELIFINDGSSDQTEQIALSYREALQNRGIEFHYQYLENSGVSAALEVGLKMFRGEYLTWPDSDDWMEAECVRKKVQYLQNHPDKGLVLCKAGIIYESEPDKVIGILERKNTENGWLAEDLINCKDLYFAPVGWMVRASAFLETHPSRQIYHSKAGQNWQMLLPIAERYECGFLKEVLCYYLVREISISHHKTFIDKMKLTYSQQDILYHVISEMSLPEEKQKRYIKLVETRFFKKRMELAIQYGETDLLREEYSQYKKNYVFDWSVMLSYYRGKWKVINWMYKSGLWFWYRLEKWKNKVRKVV